MKKNSLILEGGGFRGVFTAGVLDYFLYKGLNFDHVVGVSCGACQACSFLSKQNGRGYHAMVDQLGRKDYFGLYSLITTGNLFNTETTYKEIPDILYPFDHKTFEENKTTFHAVVTNCLNGKAEYPLMTDMHRDIDYIQASSSMPGVSQMVYIQNTPYLDGGISDSIPIDFSISLGYEKQVVILTQPQGYIKKKNGMLPLLRVQYKKYPELIKTIANRHICYNNSLSKVQELEAQGKAFVIRPSGKLSVGRVETDKNKLHAAYKSGYYTAAKNYAKLLAFLQND